MTGDTDMDKTGTEDRRSDLQAPAVIMGGAVMTAATAVLALRQDRAGLTSAFVLGYPVEPSSLRLIWAWAMMAGVVAMAIGVICWTEDEVHDRTPPEIRALIAARGYRSKRMTYLQSMLLLSILVVTLLGIYWNYRAGYHATSLAFLVLLIPPAFKLASMVRQARNRRKAPEDPADD